MTNKEIEITYREICRSVVENHLKVAFDKLTLLLSLLTSVQSSLQEKKNQVETTY